MNEFDRYVEGTIFHIDVWNNSADDVIAQINSNLNLHQDSEKINYLLNSERFNTYFQNRFGFELNKNIAA